PSEMSQEKVIYMEPKFLYSKKRKDKRYQTHKRRKCPWHITAIILGIIFRQILSAIYKVRKTQKKEILLYRKLRMAQFYHLGQISWSESKKSCQDLGSNRIKIDDRKEQTFIQSKIKYNHWVGLEGRGANHPWMWLDGTSASKNL
ncbi:hypothetical protein E2I00_011841, partial [Balaenoptera physalus]